MKQEFNHEEYMLYAEINSLNEVNVIEENLKLKGIPEIQRPLYYAKLNPAAKNGYYAIIAVMVLGNVGLRKQILIDSYFDATGFDASYKITSKQMIALLNILN